MKSRTVGLCPARGEGKRGGGKQKRGGEKGKISYSW